MKHIMISIKPEWVAKILNGDKTIEIRKSMPKCELPCKVYIYCTKHNNYKDSLYLADDEKYDVDYYVPSDESFILNGKVVAEFTLNEIDKFNVYENGTVQYWNCFDLEKSCLTYDEISNYVGKNKIGYAWHIDDLKIYDKPKELSEFGVRKYLYAYTHDCWDVLPLRKPPQSWCYVEGE